MKNKGFTLIELLVVIAVIALLSSIIYASVSEARKKAATAVAKVQGKQVQQGIDLARESLFVSAGANPAEAGLTNTDETAALNWTPAIGKVIFPDLAQLSDDSLTGSDGEDGIGSDYTDALPTIPESLVGEDTSEADNRRNYYYWGDGERATFAAYGMQMYYDQGEDVILRCMTPTEANASPSVFLPDEYVIAFKSQAPVGMNDLIVFHNGADHTYYDEPGIQGYAYWYSLNWRIDPDGSYSDSENIGGTYRCIRD